MLKMVQTPRVIGSTAFLIFVFVLCWFNGSVPILAPAKHNLQTAVKDVCSTSCSLDLDLEKILDVQYEEELETTGGPSNYSLGVLDGNLRDVMNETLGVSKSREQMPF